MVYAKSGVDYTCEYYWTYSSDVDKCKESFKTAKKFSDTYLPRGAEMKTEEDYEALKSGTIIKANLATMDPYYDDPLPECKGDSSTYNNCKLIDEKGTWYSGQWLDGKPHGFGVIGMGDCIITGKTENGSMSGKVQQKCSVDGRSTTYEGSFKKFKKHGYGEMTYSDGLVIKGEWIDNELNEGIASYANGSYYEGEFKNMSLHGLGTLIRDDWKHVGQYENGKANGLGTEYLSNGDIYQGNYKDGERHGKGICQLSLKTISELEEGKWRRPSGLKEGQRIFECEYDMGELLYSNNSGGWLGEFVKEVTTGMAEAAVEGAIEGMIMGTFMEPCVPEVKTRVSQVIPGNSRYGTKVKTSVKYCSSPYKFK